MKKEFNFTRYRTNHKEFQFWFDKFFNSIRIHYFFTSVLSTGVLYILGLFLAIFINFQDEYIRTIPVYLCLLGVNLTLICTHYYSKKFHEIYEELRPCFLIEDINYKELISKWFRKISNNRSNFLFSIILSFLFILILYLSCFEKQYIQFVLSIKSFNPSLLEVQQWYNGNHQVIKFLILSIYAVSVAFPLATVCRALILNCGLLFELSKLRVIPIPNVIFIRFQKLTIMYSIMSFLWFIGISLVGIFLFSKLDIIAIIVISILSVLGLFTFLMPQIIYERLVLTSSVLLNQYIIKIYYSLCNISLEEQIEEIHLGKHKIDDKLDIADYSNIINSSLAVKRVIYNVRAILLLLIGQGSTFLVPYLKGLFH